MRFLAFALAHLSLLLSCSCTPMRAQLGAETYSRRELPPPMLFFESPMNGEVGVSVFTELVFASERTVYIHPGHVRIFRGARGEDAVSGTLWTSERGTVFSFRPNRRLAFAERYFVEVDAVRDEYGNVYGPYRATFCTTGYLHARSDGYLFIEPRKFLHYYWWKTSPHLRTVPPPERSRHSDERRAW